MMQSMQKIDEMYEILDELEENLEDLLDGISAAIDMIEDGQTERATQYLIQLEASLEAFLGEDETEEESDGFGVEFDDEDEGSE
ncbi:MAG: hypothetical protein LUQ14_02760 [Methanomassiliicoccales archaeon]|nr:hypothetical protein [Methanomassiliicoccales archaeon]